MDQAKVKPLGPSNSVQKKVRERVAVKKPSKKSVVDENNNEPPIEVVEEPKAKKVKISAAAISKKRSKTRGNDSSTESEEEAEPWNDQESSVDETMSEPEVIESDHELDPESDFDDENQAQPDVLNRTAEAGDDIACIVCKKMDNPQWILLCEDCDVGYHCSCLKPVLIDIPSTVWFCPDCSHQKLITALEKKLNECDKITRRFERSDLRRQRNATFAARAQEVAERRLSGRTTRRNYRQDSYNEKFKGIEGLEEDSVDKGSDKEEEDWMPVEESSQPEEVKEKVPEVARRTGKRRLLNINDSSEEENVEPAPARPPVEGCTLRSRAKH